MKPSFDERADKSAEGLRRVDKISSDNRSFRYHDTRLGKVRR